MDITPWILCDYNFLQTDIFINDEKLDIYKNPIFDFEEYVNMKKGIFSRSFSLTTEKGFENKFSFKVIFNPKLPDCFSIYIQIIPLNYKGSITITPFLKEDFLNPLCSTLPWKSCEEHISSKGSYISFNPKNSELLCYGMKCEMYEGEFKKTSTDNMISKASYTAYDFKTKVKSETPVTFFKYICILNGNIAYKDAIFKKTLEAVKKACSKGFSFDEKNTR